MNEGVFLFSTSGIVGAGKSTVISRLKENDTLEKQVQTRLNVPIRVVFLPEPVELWKERGWLYKYYGNPDLYAAAFQFIVFCTHSKAIEECISANTHRPLIIVAERSMYDQLLFWQQQRDLKKLTADDMYNDAYMMTWELRHR